MSKKDQYHHFIPRFILREFQSGTKKSNKERQEEFRKTGVVNERVYFYDVKNRNLEHRLIGTVYGVTNLYRDVTNVEQVDEVEEKFSKLEGHCAKIIQDLHKRLYGSASDRRTFPITRKDLGQLRKFLFLMHFRNSGLQQSYFDPEHPDHRSTRDVMEERWAQVPSGAKSSKDVWLHAMKYYLDTPHSQILLQVAERAPGKANLFTLLKTLNPDIIENADLMDAITYHQQADLFYLSVVQAAPGHEFTLGNSTFGLWEGVIGDGPTAHHGVHRIYVISPRIALILRLNIYLDCEPGLLEDTKSRILSIKLPQPSCTFGFQGSESFLAMAQYRASPASQNDLFSFPIVKLSVEETFHLNTIVLQNVGMLGSLTFKDPSCMRITLRKFWRFNNRLTRFICFQFLSLMQTIGLAIRGQPEDFDSPPNRVFVSSTNGGEAKITTVASLSKAAARKKRKGKGKNLSNTDEGSATTTLIAESPPVESPGDRVMALAQKRVQGGIPVTRERYEDSLEAWNIMHLVDEPHPYKDLFHITAARFKKLGELFLHLPHAPGFAPSPNAQLKASNDIASDTTIKAIFDGGGRWFDEWEDNFRLHVAEEVPLEVLLGIRNTKHLLRDMLILEVVTWLARNRHDILQHVVIPNVDLSLYLTTAADTSAERTGTPSSADVADHSPVSESIHTTTTPTNDPAPSQGLTPVDETNSTPESLSTTSPKKKKNKKKNQSKKPAVVVVDSNAQSRSTLNVHQTTPETPSTSAFTAAASVDSEETTAEQFVNELCLVYGDPDGEPTDARTRYKHAFALREACLSPHASEIMRDDHLAQTFLQLSEGVSRLWFGALKPVDKSLGVTSSCRMKDGTEVDDVPSGSIEFFFFLFEEILGKIGVNLRDAWQSDLESQRNTFPDEDEDRWRIHVYCSQGFVSLLLDMLAIDVYSRVSRLRPDTLTFFKESEHGGLPIGELFL
ncbi:hypothetical protein BJ165DRAFT_858025 [Panaeolus papilionaceus]|nr:hypothetical protein BJ165DRAFT_858025 [Panaeolus papilionaceus]